MFFVFSLQYLISPAKDVKGNGELIDKLTLALTYSAQPVSANLNLLDFTAIKKCLPNLLLTATPSNKQNFTKSKRLREISSRRGTKTN